MIYALSECTEEGKSMTRALAECTELGKSSQVPKHTKRGNC